MQASVKAALWHLSRGNISIGQRFDSTPLERVKFDVGCIKQTHSSVSEVWRGLQQCRSVWATSLCGFTRKSNVLWGSPGENAMFVLSQDSLQVRDASDRWQSDIGRCLWPRPQSAAALHSRQTSTAQVSANVHKLQPLQRKLWDNALLRQRPKLSSFSFDLWPTVSVALR